MEMQRLNDIAARFEGLELRERWLVFLAALVILWLIVDSIAIAPVGKTLQREQAELRAAESELASTRQQLSSLQSILANDPMSIKIQERAALQQQVSELEDELSALTGGLVKAEALPKILEEMLSQVGNLQLQELVTKPAEAQMAGVYKHGVVLRLTGGFVEVLEYLKVLENLPWKFYWEAIDYRVQEYPSAEVEINVYTLSTAEGLFHA